VNLPVDDGVPLFIVTLHIPPFYASIKFDLSSLKVIYYMFLQGFFPSLISLLVAAAYFLFSFSSSLSGGASEF